MIEILSPVGSFASLTAAIDAGADAVYFGVDQLNMRAGSARNFSCEDLKEIVKRCKKHSIKTYLTLNIVIYDQDILAVKEICNKAKEANIDAIIASDMAVISYARSIGLAIHISTQLNVGNIEAVEFYSQYADVIVLARELSLEQIAHICQEIKNRNICGPSKKLIKIEVFVHGALCVAISGKCYMSLALYHSSANRGKCYQACRRKYRVIEEDTGKELLLDNHYVMSPKDLCTIDFIDKIIEAGVSILKIEGRGRSPEYVQTVTRVYREAYQSVVSRKFSLDKINTWKEELQSVYNRGFWLGGYYLGKELGEWANSYGSNATQKKIYAGKVTNYFSKSKIGEFKLEASHVKKNDNILIIGPTTGVVQEKISSLSYHDEKNTIVTFPVVNKIRRNDQLFVLSQTLE